MNARVPIRYQQGAMGERRRMVWLQQLLICWTLHRHFGFGKARLLKFLNCNNADSLELGQMKHGYAENRTWQDELWAWGEHMGLNQALKEGDAK